MLKFIENIGDYFASNYFDEDFRTKVFDKSGYAYDDLKEFNKRISPLKDRYYRYKNEFLALKRPKDRIKLTHAFHTQVLNALQYNGDVNDYDGLCLLNGSEGIPVRSKLYRGDKPHLYIMEMQSMIQDGDTPPPGLFDQRYHREQWELVFQITDPDITLSPSIINAALSELFLVEQSRRPFYVLLLAGSELYLLHYEKWFRGSYLRFSLEDLFDEAALTRDYYALFYFLLAKETLAPDSDIVLMDQLDEDSHKSAYAVTQDLKSGVIQAIEDLANEAVFYLSSSDRMPELDENFATGVKDAALTLVYRLLFLFYAESRPELEILPVNDEVYEKGYSLEMLRDLEQTPLQSDSARNGYFFHDSLYKLFHLIGGGHNETAELNRSFSVKLIDSPLFDDSRLRVLQMVKFRNFIWQDIIRQLSLSQKQRGKTRGRISYANLGINQLGSVYEGLLSYRGFFAAEDYIVVKQADDKSGKEGTWVVPRRRRGDFSEDEILKDEENPERDRIIPKGAFIYRLSGRDRQKSASYYTPEVLTRTTVKYTLKPILERLEKGEIAADELLRLKILEPAMGAAAFHNEAVDQIAAAYLDWKQKEKGKKIAPNDYREELQRVKAYIATHNVYGVDINPTAVELGKLSLWLNVIHREMQPPFFGYRLGVGNAVVGAWRKVYTREDIIIQYTGAGRTQYEKKEWWNKAPRLIPWQGKGSKRRDDEIWHFLLPDKNMAPSAGIELLKKEYPQQAKAVSEWRKAFTRPFTGQEFGLLQTISRRIDELFEAHYRSQKKINDETRCDIPVWGQPQQQTELFGYSQKEQRAAARDQTNAPYYKLKMIMDYWCSLWFWDVRDAAELPTREEYLSDLMAILEVDLAQALAEAEAAPAEDLFAPPREQTELDLGQEAQLRLKSYKSDEEKNRVAVALARTAAQVALLPDRRKELIQSYSRQYRFFHYELEFIEVFRERGGFDVIVGNPPWVVVIFDESGIVGDRYPEVLIRNVSAPQVREKLKALLKDKVLFSIYADEANFAESSSIFMGAMQNQPLLQGQKADIYKSVLTTSSQLVSNDGYFGLVHPESIYDDAKGMHLRAFIYPRLSFHFQFVNELKLFSDVHHLTKFGIHVYSGREKAISFLSMSNLFHPSTIGPSLVHAGQGLVQGYKAKDPKTGEFVWNLQPHADRVITFTEAELRLLARTFENSDEWQGTKLVAIHARPVLQVLEKIGSFIKRAKDYEPIISVCWDETKAAKEKKIIEINKCTQYPNYNNCELILNGPHFYVSNPLYKTPQKVYGSNADYDSILLEDINDEFIPKTRFIPNVCVDTLNDKILPKVSNINWLNLYKWGARRRIGSSSERTLIPCIISPSVTHTNTVITLSLRDSKRIVEFASITSSIPLDFFIKVKGKADLYKDDILKFPLGVGDKFLNPLIHRCLLLNCLNMHYSKLWNDLFSYEIQKDGWSMADARLKDFSKLESRWNWSVPLRNPFERRLALVEIDVIAAMSLSLTFDELATIYSLQFPVLQQNENETYYDRNGRIVFTVNSGLSDIGVDRKTWEQIREMPGGEYTWTMNTELYPNRPITFVAPFDHCDRVEDYRRAWAHFEKVFSEK